MNKHPGRLNYSEDITKRKKKKEERKEKWKKYLFALLELDVFTPSNSNYCIIIVLNKYIYIYCIYNIYNININYINI